LYMCDTKADGFAGVTGGSGEKNTDSNVMQQLIVTFIFADS